jgi:hypothetical protein
MLGELEALGLIVGAEARTVKACRGFEHVLVDQAAGGIVGRVDDGEEIGFPPRLNRLVLTRRSF